MTEGQLLLLVLAGTLILPTIAYIAVRGARRGPRPRAAKIAGWLCLWTGQLAVLMVGVAVFAGALAHSYWSVARYLLALVYGVAMVGFAGFLFVQLLRVLRLGTLALGQATEEAIGVVARRVFPRGLLGLAVAAAYVWAIPAVLPMPGRFDDAFFFALAVVPVSLTALLVTLIAGVLRKPPWL